MCQNVKIQELDSFYQTEYRLRAVLANPINDGPVSCDLIVSIFHRSMEGLTNVCACTGCTTNIAEVCRQGI